MSFLAWVALAGSLLLVMALSSAMLRRLPISASLIYLACGIAIGPIGLQWVQIDLVDQSRWFERLAEVAVIVSLFVGGLKLRLPVRDQAWRAAFVLAGPVMLVTIAGVALFSNLVLGLPLPLSLLLGAILAPTDPVLAGSVKVSNAADEDRLRYGLSGEAGLNDGAAFPFVILALSWMTNESPGTWLLRWGIERLLWAVPAGLIFGYMTGRLGGRLAIRLRSHHRDVDAPNDFLALALIALTYAAAEAIHAWGFLAVFAAGVGVRSAELKVVDAHPHPDHQRIVDSEVEAGDHPPAENMIAAKVDGDEMKQPAVAAGVVLHEVILFGDTIERLLEILLVGLVGIMIGTYWDWRALPLAAALFFVIRPLAARLLLIPTATSSRQGWLMGWFGIRGIGSLYYLTYSLNHGVESHATTAIGLTISVIALSIVFHGASGTPLLERYERSLAKTA